MKKIYIKRTMRVGSTIGAYLYNYFIRFDGPDSWSYTFSASVEGMGKMIVLLKEAGHEVDYTDQILGEHASS